MEEKLSKVINQSSVEVIKNTRGWTYSVKAYGDTPELIKAELKLLLAIAKQLTLEEGKAE